MPWPKEEMVEKLEEFSHLYKYRPIRHNTWGMKSPHLFLAWFVLQKLKPKVIIESGVYLGQGTWFFERACPNAKLYCIDINLHQIKYKSEKAKYFNRDFSTIDWSHLPKNETVLFFDDHQNAYERVKTARFFGFSQLLFEDNYPPQQQGDCYSLKQAFAHSGCNWPYTKKQMLKICAKNTVKTIFNKPHSFYKKVPPNNVDATYLREHIEIYQELPPIFQLRQTRWGDNWDNAIYPTPEPLLNRVEEPYQQVFWDEAMFYTWLCYVKLKN